MVIRYLIARLKKTILPTIGISLALSAVVFLLVVATAMPDILEVATENHSRRISGDADLVLTNAHNTPDRFFGLTRLREDPVLAEHAKYIYGLFWTYAQLDTGDGQRSFGTVFAGDMQAQSLHNPLVPGIMPGFLPESGIIIGEDFAKEQNIRLGDRMYVVFGGRRVGFDVMGIARNEGLLATGNAVFIPSAAMSRIIPMVGTGIVTHAFIRANNSESLGVITRHLEIYYYRLRVVSGGEAGYVQRVVNQFSIHIFLVAVITVIFCLMSLFLLLRLAFSRDKQNFMRLSTLGMRQSRLVLISVLYGLLLCAFGVGFAVSALQITASIIASIPILTGYRFGAFPYVFGIGSGLTAGIICSVFSIFAPSGVSSKSKCRIVFCVIWFFLFLLSGIAGILLETHASNLALVFICGAFFGLLLFPPYAIALLTSKIHSKAKNIFTLRLKTLTNNRGYGRFVSFGLIVTLVMIMAVSLPIETRRAAEPPLLPFDSAVIAITDPSAEVFEAVTVAGGVDIAVRAEVDLRADLTFGNLEFGGNLFGLDEDGFALFGANFGATVLFDGAGAVIGRRMAVSRRLRVGDEFIYSRQGRKHVFIVAEIFETDYLGGSVVLVDLAVFAKYGRPYSDILIASGGDTDYVMRNVAMIDGLYGAVLSINDLANFVVATFGEFAWLINWLSAVIITLAAITVALMIVIRQLAEERLVSSLIPLGLTKANHLKQMLFSVFVALFSAFMSIPVFVFLITQASFSFFNMFGIRDTIRVNPSVAIVVTLLCFIFITAVEAMTVAAKRPEKHLI